MHIVAEPGIFYLGTPVVLVSTRNPDGSANVAPFSSAWWLGWSCMLGLNGSSQTVLNITRERQCVINVPSADLVGYVDRLALLTGNREMSTYKKESGYRYEPDKFGVSGLTPAPADLVRAPLVGECPIQLECTISRIEPFGEADPRIGSIKAVEALVIRAHIEESLLVPGTTKYIDPHRWKPLIMSFTEFFGLTDVVHPSLLSTIFAPKEGD